MLDAPSWKKPRPPKFLKGGSATSWLTGKAPVVSAKTGQPSFLPILQEGDFYKGSLTGPGKRCCFLGWLNWSFHGHAQKQWGDAPEVRVARQAFQNVVVAEARKYVIKENTAPFLVRAARDGKGGLPLYNDNDGLSFKALATVWNRAVARWVKT